MEGKERNEKRISRHGDSGQEMGRSGNWEIGRHGVTAKRRQMKKR
jgi:hypothetical protein